GSFHAMVKGTAEAIRNPFYKALALQVNHSDWICLAMDQLLGRKTGRVFNDEAFAVAAGTRQRGCTRKLEHVCRSMCFLCHRRIGSNRVLSQAKDQYREKAILGCLLLPSLR